MSSRRFKKSLRCLVMQQVIDPVRIHGEKDIWCIIEVWI